jgi:uncharacterized SAM-binding protein YcdF (DUF218 family)
MFYVLSKILGLLINPIVWILSLLFFAFFVKKAHLKKWFSIAAFACLLIFSNKFILNELLIKWERKAPDDATLLVQYDYGIVLSGMVWYNSQTRQINFLQSSDRIWQAVRLYKEKRIKKILIAGGSAEFFAKDTVESVLLKGFLVKIGIPAEDIITEENSRNTRENAVFTAKLLQNFPHKNLLLITSAMHMPRAELCFRKVGLNCDIYPADQYSGSRRFGIEDLFVPNARTLFNWNAFIHELFGMASYKIAGYI